MAASGLWRSSFGLGLLPLEALEIEFIDVVEGASIVVDAAMASKDDDFVFVGGHGMVGPGLRPSNFGHGIFGDPC